MAIKLQKIIYETAGIILEKHPIPKAEVERMCTDDYTRRILGFELGGLSLLRNESEGREISDRPRYKQGAYGNYPEKYYISNHWWKDFHKHNAQRWIKYLEKLIDSDSNQDERNKKLSSLVQEYKDYMQSI